MLEEFVIDLLAHLQRVAAIDEDDGAIVENNGGAGRSGKAGDPHQPFGVIGDVFVLVFIVMRDKKAVETALLHLCTQQRQVFPA